MYMVSLKFFRLFSQQTNSKLLGHQLLLSFPKSSSITISAPREHTARTGPSGYQWVSAMWQARGTGHFANGWFLFAIPKRIYVSSDTQWGEEHFSYVHPDDLGGPKSKTIPGSKVSATFSTPFPQNLIRPNSELLTQENCVDSGILNIGGHN